MEQSAITVPGCGGDAVTGLGLDDAAVTALAKQLKAMCGSGGTEKDGVIEVHSDNCDCLIDAMKR